MNKPYGIEIKGSVFRKWEKGEQTILNDKSPGEGWRQVPLSMWDYIQFKVVEYEPLKEVSNAK